MSALVADSLSCGLQPARWSLHGTDLFRHAPQMLDPAKFSGTALPLALSHVLQVITERFKQFVV